MPLRLLWMLGVLIFISIFRVYTISAKTKKDVITKKHLTYVSKAMTREEILRYAMEHNFSLRVLQARVQMALAKHRGTLVFPNNPTLSGGGGIQTPAGNVPSFGGGPLALPNVSVVLSLPLPVGGRWGREQQLAFAEWQWWQQKSHLRRFHFSIELHRALNRLAVAWHIQQKRHTMVSFFEHMEGLLRKKLRHGAATQIELQFAQSSMLEAQQEALLATLQYRLMGQQLKTLLGWVTAEQDIPWKTKEIPDFPVFPKVSVLLSSEWRMHPRIRLTQMAIARAKAALAFSKTQAFADWTFSLGYSLEDNNHIVRGSVSVPLPIFWRNQSNVNQAHTALHRAALLLAQARFRLRQRIQQTHMQYQMHLKMMQLFHSQLQAMQARSRLIEQGIRQGSFSVFEALTTQHSVLKNQILYLQRVQTTHDSYLDLCLASGIVPKYMGILRSTTHGS